MNAQKTQNLTQSRKGQRKDKIHHRDTEADPKTEGFDLSSAERLGDEAKVQASPKAETIDVITTETVGDRAIHPRKAYIRVILCPLYLRCLGYLL
jgi:hypothetical protein